MLLTPVCAIFFHPFSISLVICCWNCNMMHVFCVPYPFLIYSNCSACSLPHFCCPFSYTVTELCIFLGFTASHLLQPSCSSFCQQSFIIYAFLIVHLISLFTFILPIALAYCFACHSFFSSLIPGCYLFILITFILVLILTHCHYLPLDSIITLYFLAFDLTLSILTFLFPFIL